MPWEHADSYTPVPRLKPEKAPDTVSQPEKAKASGLKLVQLRKVAFDPAGTHPPHLFAEPQLTDQLRPDTDQAPLC